MASFHASGNTPLVMDEFISRVRVAASVFAPSTCFLFIDAHGLKIQREGQGGFCQILGGRVYRGCENFGGRVHLFGVLLHFY
jgi:hypothetical protein